MSMLSKQYVVCSESHLSSSIFFFNEQGDVLVSCIASFMNIHVVLRVSMLNYRFLLVTVVL